MLAHDKKVQQRKGERPHGYVPRADHPLLKPKGVVTATEEDDEEEAPPVSAVVVAAGATAADGANDGSGGEASGAPQ
jgi:hypothetical protein